MMYNTNGGSAINISSKDDEKDDDETTPLSGGRGGNNVSNSRIRTEMLIYRYLFWIAIITGSIIGISIVTHRRNHKIRMDKKPQEIIVVSPATSTTTTATTTTTTIETPPLTTTTTTVSYRPYCEYYISSSTNSKKTTVTPAPYIIQTSMSEASHPWNMKPCIQATNPKYVKLNTALAPDAVLQTNFSIKSINNINNKPIIGFGGAFTEAAALNYKRLNNIGQQTVLELLFGKTGLGYSIGRVHMNSVDFSVESYNFDNVEDDFDLSYFDMNVTHDVNTGMIHMIQNAISVYEQSWPNETSHNNNNNNNNSFHLFASPWSPPEWMKKPTEDDLKENTHAVHSATMTHSTTPNCIRDGLGPNSKYAKVWALYFTKFIKAYKDHNINMWAVTVQNEPEFPAPWEACAYTSQNMTEFIAYHLGPIMKEYCPNTTIFAFDHNKDHINAWMMTMLNGTTYSDDYKNNDIMLSSDNDQHAKEISEIASQYIGGTAYHWYAGGMDRLLDGALGIANMHRFQENIKNLGVYDNHIVLGSESCHCPTTGYAGGSLEITWDRAERYAHTILADLAAGSQGWVEWNLILDAIGGPNHLGNLCETTILSVPHRAINASTNIPALPDFEKHKPFGNRIIGDERTREELNALGFPAKFLDVGIAVQPMYYYMGHISRYVRPGSIAVPGLVQQSLGSGQIYRPIGATVAGGGENDLARNGIEILLWPCEGSTRQQFHYNIDSAQRISVLGHDWVGNQTKSCFGRGADKDFLGIRLTDCSKYEAGSYDIFPIENDPYNRYTVRLMNHPTKGSEYCLTILKLQNNGGTYGPLGGAQVTLGDCIDESAKWVLDANTGTASSLYLGTDDSNNNVIDTNQTVCMTTGWPFLQMGAFLTPSSSSSSSGDGYYNKTVIILNEAKESANYALKDDENVIITGSIPPRSIQTVLL